MKAARRLVSFGLLWLSFSALSFATPLLTTFTLTGYPRPVLAGGEIEGNIAGGPTIDVFCVDYRNGSQDFYTTYSAYVSDASDLSKTRAGLLNPADFTYQGAVLTALDRYTLTAWLSTQFTFTPANPDDEAIQTAMWLLMVNSPSSPAIQPSQALVDTWLTNAVTFKNTDSAGYASIQNNMRIITDVATSAPGVDRFDVGGQEFVHLNAVPEPAPFALMGLGLMGLALVRRRR